MVRHWRKFLAYAAPLALQLVAQEHVEMNMAHGIETLIPLDEWRASVAAGAFNRNDGSGCWVKDGQAMSDNCFDDVFSEPPSGATHVAWYNR